MAEEQKALGDKKPIQKFKDWTTQSSQVGTTKYNEEQKILTVQFQTGAMWNYYEVPVDVWEKLLKASSVGKFLNTEIKPKYEAKKIN